MNKTPVLKRLSYLEKLFLIVIIVIPVLFYGIINYFTLPGSLNSSKIQIEIPKGSALIQIADTLQAHHLIEDKDIFIFWTTYLGYEKKLKAGHFTVPYGKNEYQLVEYLLKAKENTISITLLEGWNIEQIAGEIAKKLEIIPKIIPDNKRIAKI